MPHDEAEARRIGRQMVEQMVDATARRATATPLIRAARALFDRAAGARIAIVDFWQRGRRGWAGGDLEHLDVHLAIVIGGAVAAWSVDLPPLPGEYGGDRPRWEADLRRCAAAFRDYRAIGAPDAVVAESEYHRAMAEVRWALEFLGRYWDKLWDWEDD